MATKPKAKAKSPLKTTKTTITKQPTAVAAINPGKNMAIAGFVLSFFSILSIAGLILSIIALVKSSRANYKNALAIVGIVLSSINIFVVTPFIAAIAVGAAIGISDSSTAQNTCSNQDNIGVVTVDATQYNCQPFGVIKTSNN